MYIGKHKTKVLDDGYLGSGTKLKNDMIKFGENNFRKEWLMFCEDEDEMNLMEGVYVDQTWVERSDTYNVKIGGLHGGIKGFSPYRKTKTQRRNELKMKRLLSII